ncbi:hypothetical protein G7066_02800 [Leucobacter coleopterorum]|uniref:Uncharacterized protein n=1 Tax=Leucobacter coleopterorum TaxID=2714933 RepID=A0ABX6JUB7_9MICO|nr:hypothetical protein [Leucobacter coleopterorum]QIM17878.1 hypothetical protein G7066_02800 [Leucobacter coleopterorum]
MTALLMLGFVAPPAMAVETAPESVYELTVNGETVVLDEGESVTFGMQAISPPPEPGKVMPRAIFTSNAGTLTVTGAKGKFTYGIAMAIPATSFVGVFSVTNLTNGQSGGAAPVWGFSGTVGTSNLKGHRYSGSLSGTADLLGVPVAHTMPNYTVFQN